MTRSDEFRLEQLREILPAGRERALASLASLQKLILAHPDDFPDGGAAALAGVDWMRKLLEAEYEVSEVNCGEDVVP